MGNDQQTEIDLIELSIKFYKFIIKKKWLLLFSFAIGLTIGAITIKLNPLEYKDYYRKKYVSFFPEDISKEILTDILKGLQENISSNNRNLTRLSVLLNLPVDVIKDLKKIDITTDEIGKKNEGEKFTIEVLNKEKIDSIANHIIHYINSNPYVKTRYEIFINQKTELLSLINKKIHEIDSSSFNKKTYNAQHLLGTPIIIDRVSSEFTYIKLFEQKQLIEKDLNLFRNNVYFIETKSPSIFISNRPVVIATIIGYGFLGVIIGFIIFIIPKLRSSLKAILAQKG